MNRSGRARRRLAFALALAVSGAHLTTLAEAAAFAPSLRSQTKTASHSKDRTSPNGRQSEPKSSSTRSRKAEPAADVDYDSPDGPIIRIALMTDVTTVTLGCASGLMVSRASSSFDEGRRVPGGSLRVELSQQSNSGPPAPIETGAGAGAYRVVVRYSYEARVARSLVEELKKKFFEPVTMTYDENQNEYAVLIGQCPTRAEATKLAERLRKAGYEGLRIVSDPTPENLAPVSQTAGKTPIAKYKNQPAGGRASQLVAFAADKIAATSADELIVAPAEGASTTSRIKQIAASGDDVKARRGREDQKGLSPQHGAVSQPPAVRVGGRDYRGEMHLVLNARGLINVVNVLPLEDYLRGVVLMEIPMGSPREIEALKAQAVAARSYALSHLGHHQDRGYDLVDDARAQAYGGLTSERELTNLATDQTRGVAAVYPNEAGRLVPIEALYTANCGGRTENNEEVFGGKARGYLRSVVCVPERQPVAGRDIVTSRTPEPLNGTDGRLIGREVATLSVLGFSLPRRVTNSYLQGAPDRDEVRSWAEQTAKLARREKPSFARGDVTRLAEFARLIAASVYGDGRASSLLDPADVDYVLAGVRVEQLPREARADVAMLVRDGILRLHSGALDGRATITRGQAIETLARAVLFKSTADLKSQTSSPRSQTTDFRMETSAPAQRGRLFLIAPGSSGNTASRGQTPRFTSVNISGPASMGETEQEEPRENQSLKAKEIPTPRVVEQDGSRRNLRPDGIEIAEGAWLFRNVGGESYGVDRLAMIGGERVTYHLNAAGQADFLEASVSAHSASSERLSTVGSWQERVTVEELQQRLARARIDVGEVKTVEPVAFSTSKRVWELEVTGDHGHSLLRGRQIISALGLKETLFVVAAEKDGRGRVAAFVFTGRGWGHGVGMCQHGAYALAKDGQPYTAILQKYYTGVKVQRMY